MNTAFKIVAKTLAVAVTATSVALCTCASLSWAQTSTKPAPPVNQPAYPSSPTPNAPPPQRRVNPPPTAKPAKPDCTQLKGVEKAECERRDTVDDDARAGVTTAMKDKQRAKENEDAVTSQAEPASDTEKNKPASTAAARDEQSKEDSSEDAKQRKQDREQSQSLADDADTLGAPPP